MPAGLVFAVLACGGRVLDEPYASDGGTRGTRPGLSGSGTAHGTAPFEGVDGAVSLSSRDGSPGQGAGSLADGGSTSVPPPGASEGEAAGTGSCALEGSGLSDCGASREGCCISLEVSGGTSYRTYANDGNGVIGEADPATVSGFRLDKYLVTVGRFRRFVRAWDGGWRPQPGSGKHASLNGGRGLANAGSPGSFESGWDASGDTQVAPTDANLACANWPTWTPAAGSQEVLPINCVNWWEAYAFCIWDSGFLPSEAEWAYAASGGSEQRAYPWGEAAPGEGNEYAIYGCHYPDGDTCAGTSNIAPVGTASSGAALWGQLDLAGNLYEWSLDAWSPSYVTPCIDCANLPVSSTRVVRGGAFDNPAAALLATNRTEGAEAGRYDGQGFRCARAP